MAETESTKSGTESNKPVGEEDGPPPQTADQFYDPAVEAAKAAEADVDPKHATKGMTAMGYSEASRIENTTEAFEAERKAAEKAAAKEDKS